MLSARLFLTVALIYTIHFAPNVVRETYLAVSIAERFSIRVDPYLDLHPDVFEIPGRGAYINSNPGASMLGAIPYAIARPAFELLYRWRPGLVSPKPPAAYNDARPNRTLFMNRMRERGLDVRLALAAAAIHLGFNVPLGAFAALLMFWFLRDRLGNARTALWLSLLYALGTPLFFRSAFLNQNLVLAHCTLIAFLAVVWRREDRPVPPRLETGRLLIVGAVLGVGLASDYSAAPLLLVFGLWVTLLAVRDRGAISGLQAGATFTLGAAGPIAVLLLYQYAAFGDPFLPAQAYMDRTELSVTGWHGVNLLIPELLWRNLVDPRYGLFAFCPMLAGAFFASKYRGRHGSVSGDQLALIFGSSMALYLFASSISFALLQWNTGVRYLVPLVPLLFVALVPVLLHGPRPIVWALVVTTLMISWAVSMARESVPTSLAQFFTSGLQLPWHTVLTKTAAAYAPTLPLAWVPYAVVALVCLVLWFVWRPVPVRPS